MYQIFDKLRKNKGVSVYRVAKETGISQSTFTAWKSGEYVPKHEKLVKLADYFGVSVDYLLTGEEPNQKQNPEDNLTFDDFTYALHNETHELSEEDKELLLTIAKELAKHRREKEQRKAKEKENG